MSLDNNDDDKIWFWLMTKTLLISSFHLKIKLIKKCLKIIHKKKKKIWLFKYFLVCLDLIWIPEQKKNIQKNFDIFLIVLKDGSNFLCVCMNQLFVYFSKKKICYVNLILIIILYSNRYSKIKKKTFHSKSNSSSFAKKNDLIKTKTKKTLNKNFHIGKKRLNHEMMVRDTFFSDRFDQPKKHQCFLIIIIIIMW